MARSRAKVTVLFPVEREEGRFGDYAIQRGQNAPLLSGLTRHQGVPKPFVQNAVLSPIGRFDWKSVAEMVGAPENTVKTWMRYVLERLSAAPSEIEKTARPSG